jgi:lipopolysaccharide transport system ATP-binding protein
MTSAIEISGVGKQYRRGMQAYTYNRASEVMANWGKRLIGAGPREARAARADETFWALKDISLTIEQGQVVGIIGRNGSGKSTLLKIISQITAPTTGELRITGRTGTLLEVGTGFHPELSGRENVFLNGAILGMSRQEIARKFDEIVDFAGVEAFIDTPVKRYSSGMQTRLAFSVAAYLDPEILIVDEVLAVGDAEFQKKCLGKMQEASKGEGRTVLFVSHNMGAVDQLCDRVIWLDKGHLVLDSSDTRAATSQYLCGNDEDINKSEVLASDVMPLDTEFFVFRRMRICDSDGMTVSGTIGNNTSVRLEIELDIKKVHPSLSIGYAVYNEAGETVYWSIFTDEDAHIASTLTPGRTTISTMLPRRLLNEGLYRIELMTSLHFICWFSEPGNTDCAVFLRIEGGLSDSSFFQARRPGIIAPIFPWRCSTSR